MTDNDLIKQQLLDTTTYCIECGYDVNSIAANLVIIGLNIYKQVLPNEEYLKLVDLIHANANEIGNTPKVIH